MQKEFFIILLSGFSCAGKSTIAISLCEEYGLDFINQQTVVHDLAKLNNFERVRYWLKEVGKENLIKESIKKNISIISEFKNNKGFVFDVVYNEDIIVALSNSFPNAKLVVVSIFADVELRQKRMMGRLNASIQEAIEELKFRDGFLIQAGLEKVINTAHITVSNTGELDNTMSQLNDKLKFII